jgi:hypothetical protein
MRKAPRNELHPATSITLTAPRPGDLREHVGVLRVTGGQHPGPVAAAGYKIQPVDTGSMAMREVVQSSLYRAAMPAPHNTRVVQPHLQPFHRLA